MPYFLTYQREHQSFGESCSSPWLESASPPSSLVCNDLYYSLCIASAAFVGSVGEVGFGGLGYGACWFVDIVVVQIARDAFVLSGLEPLVYSVLFLLAALGSNPIQL